MFETVVLVASLLAPVAVTRIDEWAPSVSRKTTPNLSTSSVLVPETQHAPSEDELANISTDYFVDRLQSLQEELESYGSLQDGWDLSDGKAPLSSTIDIAKNLLNELPSGAPIPRPMAAGDGRIGLYWDTDNAFADIEIEPDGSFSLFTRRKDGEELETFDELALPNDNDKLPHLLATRLGALFNNKNAVELENA